VVVDESVVKRDDHMDEPLASGEMVVASGYALWRENPYAESRGDAQGVLYLTNMRLVFETEQVSPFVALTLDSFDGAELTDRRRGPLVMLLLVESEPGGRKTFWVERDLGERVVRAVRTAERLDEWPPPGSPSTASIHSWVRPL
jgi:hypothetical protein